MPVADLLLAAGEILGDDHGDLVEILLIVQIALHQHVLGLLDEIGNGVGVHRRRDSSSQDFLGGGNRRRRSRA
jgi:hypothetical protein